ncbi:MAG: hypothetical protein IJ592_04400, partial [Candidatus Methanomethylophilaceae archaeon]|nr:hypothetical protein [Candidatus Methanomethylophilaceae archaeon]
NTIVRHKMIGSYDVGFESPARIRRCDYAEVVMVHLGKLGDKRQTAIGLLNTLFSKNVSKEERIRRCEEEYKIVLDPSLFNEVDDLMVNLDEDFKRYMTRLGREEGKKEEATRQRAIFVDILSDSIIRVMQQEALSFDASFDKIGYPEEYRQDVKAAVEAKGV